MFEKIDVDFDVYKQLTVRRATAAVTYNDVIRELLGLPAIDGAAPPSKTAWVYKGVTFPEGTEFRSDYKGRMHSARVDNGKLLLDGQTYDSPSAAAVSITGSAVNGWRFWECKLSGSAKWQPIDSLREAKS